MKGQISVNPKHFSNLKQITAKNVHQTIMFRFSAQQRKVYYEHPHKLLGITASVKATLESGQNKLWHPQHTRPPLCTAMETVESNLGIRNCTTYIYIFSPNELQDQQPAEPQQLQPGTYIPTIASRPISENNTLFCTSDQLRCRAHGRSSPAAPAIDM